jgi:hypothetical protein
MDVDGSQVRCLLRVLSHFVCLVAGVGSIFPSDMIAEDRAFSRVFFFVNAILAEGYYFVKIRTLKH